MVYRIASGGVALPNDWKLLFGGTIPTHFVPAKLRSQEGTRCLECGTLDEWTGPVFLHYNASLCDVGLARDYRACKSRDLQRLGWLTFLFRTIYLPYILCNSRVGPS